MENNCKLLKIALKVSLTYYFTLKKVVVVVVESQSCAQLFCDPKDCSLPGPLCPWDFPGKNSVVGCHFLLQEIFLTQELNLGLLLLPN